MLTAAEAHVHDALSTHRVRWPLTVCLASVLMVRVLPQRAPTGS